MPRAYIGDDDEEMRALEAEYDAAAAADAQAAAGLAERAAKERAKVRVLALLGLHGAHDLPDALSAYASRRCFEHARYRHVWHVGELESHIAEFVESRAAEDLHSSGLHQPERLTAVRQLLGSVRTQRHDVQGAAVARQRAVWERALELRILLQRCLAASHQLPRPEVSCPWLCCTSWSIPLHVRLHSRSCDLLDAWVGH